MVKLVFFVDHGSENNFKYESEAYGTRTNTLGEELVFFTNHGSESNLTHQSEPHGTHRYTQSRVSFFRGSRIKEKLYTRVRGTWYTHGRISFFADHG